MAERDENGKRGGGQAWRLDGDQAAALKERLEERATGLGLRSNMALGLTFVCLLIGAVGFFFAGDLILEESAVSVTSLENRAEEINGRLARLEVAAARLETAAAGIPEAERLRDSAADVTGLLQKSEGLLALFNEARRELGKTEGQSPEDAPLGDHQWRLLGRLNQTSGDLHTFPALEILTNAATQRDLPGLLGGAEQVAENWSSMNEEMRQEISELQQNADERRSEKIGELAEQAGKDLEQLKADLATVAASAKSIETAYLEKGEGTRLLAALGTRLVVLVILVFLVQILVSLYRYYGRLESFYRARADVMSLAPSMDAATLQSVVSTLGSDALEYKPPTSPTEQAVEILKSVGGSVHR